MTYGNSIEIGGEDIWRISGRRSSLLCIGKREQARDAIVTGMGTRGIAGTRPSIAVAEEDACKERLREWCYFPWHVVFYVI